MKIDEIIINIGYGIVILIFILILINVALEITTESYMVTTIDGKEILCKTKYSDFGEVKFTDCEDGYEYTNFIKYKTIKK